MEVDLKVHHIGYAIKDLYKALNLFSKLGYQIVADPIKDEKRAVNIAFVKNNSYLVELISPLNSESPIKNYINKIGNTPYHFCYMVKNLEDAIADLRKLKFIVIEKPSEAIALDNKRVSFLYNPNYGLLELIESNE